MIRAADFAIGGVPPRVDAEDFHVDPLLVHQTHPLVAHDQRAPGRRRRRPFGIRSADDVHKGGDEGVGVRVNRPDAPASDTHLAPPRGGLQRGEPGARARPALAR